MPKLNVSSPYPVNLHAYLRVFCVRERADVTAVFDDLTSAVVAALLQLSNTVDQHIVLWRGHRSDPLQEGRRLWVLGIDYDAPESVHCTLFDSLAGRHDDSSRHHRMDTGCTPFALFADGKLYVFSHHAQSDPGCKLTLGTRQFLCELITCTAAEPTSLPPNEADPGDDWSRFVDRLRPRLREGPLSNWPAICEVAGDLVVMKDQNFALNGLDRLRRLCQQIGIEVIEAPTMDFGRTYLVPDWDSILAQDFTSEPPLRLFIVLRQSLSDKEKAITLAHEFGHYVHHLPMLEFFAQAYIHIQGNPSIESGLAKLLTPETLQRAILARELRADIFASLLMLPAWTETAVRHLCGLAVTVPAGSAQSPHSLLLHLTDQYFGPTNNHLPWQHAVAHREDAEELAARIQALPYSSDATLRDRMLWCVFNRERMIPALIEDEDRIGEAVHQATSWLASFPLSEQAPPNDDATRLLNRSTVKDVELQLQGEELQTDPIIIEPAAGSACGYVALMPAWTHGARDRQWTSPQLPGHSPALLATWQKRTTQRQMGLILWPPNPMRFFSCAATGMG